MGRKETFEYKNVLVTGGYGFIGSNFIRHLFKLQGNNADEIKVVNLDKLTYASNRKNLKFIEENYTKTGRYKFIKGDICDFDLVNKILKEEKIDLIVHFAAETHVDRSIDGAFPFVETNVKGTLTLLEAARVNGNIRFHHVSTDEVFGSLDLDSHERFTEKTPYDPRSPYSASKASSDHFVRAYHETHGLPITISNCSNNYGPYEHVEKLIPLMITRALNNEDLPVYGDGRNVRDWIHVSDHCRGIIMILKRGKIGETYLLGGNAERSNITVIRNILDILHKSYRLIKFVPDRKGHDRRYAIDYSKAEKELGFSPLKSFSEGLKETIKWYKKNKWYWQEAKKDADKIAEKYLKMAKE